MKSPNCIFAFYLLIATGLTPLFSQDSFNDLTKELNTIYNDSKIAGISFAMVNQDQILYQQSFGFSNLETKTPYTHKTMHNIGSTSKTFIGIAIMQLVEQGKLDLDMDINRVLPFDVKNPFYPDSPITIRQLATHCSSIQDRNLNYALRSYISRDNEKGNRKGLPLMYKVMFRKMLKNEDCSLGDFLKNTLSMHGKWYRKKNYYKNKPGTNYNYSNIGAALAAYVVEVITGEKYEDYVSNHILKALEMHLSAWKKEALPASLFAERYIDGNPFPNYHLITFPDGGLISSAYELSTYLMTMIKGYKGEQNILSAESYQLMMANQFEIAPLKESIIGTEDRSGIFWDIYGVKGKGDIGHNGSDPGILSFMYFDPDSGKGCILITNTDSDAKDILKLLEMWEVLIAFRNNNPNL